MDLGGFIALLVSIIFVFSWFVWACGGLSVTKWFFKEYCLRPCGCIPFVALEQSEDRLIDHANTGEGDHGTNSSYVEML